MLYIVSNKFTDEEIAGISSKITDIIKNNQGVITNEIDLGKKTLAYPIKHSAYGYYKLCVFDAPRLAVANINRLAREMQEILRHCVVDYVANPVGSLKIKEETKTEKAVEEKTEVKTDVKSESKEVVPTVEKPARAPRKKKEEAPIEVVKEEVSEENKADLDDKLNNILEAKDLF